MPALLFACLPGLLGVKRLAGVCCRGSWLYATTQVTAVRKCPAVIFTNFINQSKQEVRLTNTIDLGCTKCIPVRGQVLNTEFLKLTTAECQSSSEKGK